MSICILATKEKASKIIETRKPIGLFYLHDKTAKMYIGIDNSHGHAWVEEFSDKVDCIEWLQGKERDTEQLSQTVS